MMKQFVADGVQPTETHLHTTINACKRLLSHPPQDNAIACIRYLLSLPNLPGRALIRYVEIVPESDMVRLMVEESTQEVVDEALVAALSNSFMDMPEVDEPIPPDLPLHSKYDYLETIQYLIKKATPGTLKRARESAKKKQQLPGKKAWIQMHS